MQQSKLLTLLRHFNEGELAQFDKFLSSPYFNQSEKLLKFFRLIMNYKPLFESTNLEKEKLYKALHRKKHYNDTTMRQMITDLFKLAKTFLAHEGLEKDGLEASVIRFKWLFAHGLEKTAESELETRNGLLQKLEYHDNEYYHHIQMRDAHAFNVIANKFDGSEYKLLKTFDFFTHIHSLNRNYLVNNLNNHIYVLALARIYKFPINEALLHPLEILAQPYLNQGDSVIDMYFNIFQLVRTGEEKYFYELKARFFANDKTVPLAVILEAATGLENYTALKIRAGEHRFKDQCFEIYRFEVENDYHLSNGQISHFYYQNISMMAAQTGHFDWADDFSEAYKNNLPEENREDSYIYAKAHILFGRHKFEEALRLALSHSSPFLLTKIANRVLVAGAQYELGMLNELNRELDMFAYHLKDEKLTEDRRQIYVAFVDVMRQLGELKGNYSRKKLRHLKELIDTKKELLSRNWFLEKILEFQDRNN